jgi:hypothetical protein
MEPLTYLAIAGTVIAVAAIYFVWARKLGSNKAPTQEARQ